MPSVRVDEEARRGRAGAVAFTLEQVVGQDDRRMQVAEEIADAVLGRIRQRDVVIAGKRLHEQFVEAVVRFEEVTVHRLQRIVGLVERLHGGFVAGIRRRRRSQRPAERAPRT